MKREELTAGQQYVAAGTNYPGSRWATVRCVTVLDTGRWWMDKDGHRWEGHYGSEKTYQLENGESVTLPSCCWGNQNGGSYVTKGVLCRETTSWKGSPKLTVVPLHLFRCTWEEHEERQARRELADQVQQEAIEKRREKNAKDLSGLRAFVSAYNLPGTVKPGDLSSSPPMLCLTWDELPQLVKRLKGKTP